MANAEFIQERLNPEHLLDNGVFKYQLDISEMISQYETHLKDKVLSHPDAVKLGCFVHFSDPHLNPNNKRPHARSETFGYDLDAKFYALGQFATAIEAEAHLLSGDVFHLKDQRLHTPETINHNKARIRSLLKDVYVIPGNHDLPKSSLDNYSKSAYSLIDDLPQFHSFLKPGDYKTITFKTPKGSDFVVCITGAPYFKLEVAKQIISSYDSGPQDKEGNKFFHSQIFLAHIDAMPENSPHTFWDTISFNQLFDLLPNSNIVCMGHIHQSYDVITRGHQMLSKPWSLSRVVNDLYSKEEVLEKTHLPGLSVITYFMYSDGGEHNKVGIDIHYMSLPCKPYNLAFEHEQVSRSIQKSAEMKTFIESLHAQFGDASEAFKIFSPDEIRAKISVTDEVNSLLEDYFGRVDARSK